MSFTEKYQSDGTGWRKELEVRAPGPSPHFGMGVGPVGQGRIQSVFGRELGARTPGLFPVVGGEWGLGFLNWVALLCCHGPCLPPLSSALSDEVTLPCCHLWYITLPTSE